MEFEGEAIDVERAVEQALGELNETHQRVIDLYVFADVGTEGRGAGARRAVEDNVHKIAQRFRDAPRRVAIRGRWRYFWLER